MGAASYHLAMTAGWEGGPAGRARDRADQRFADALSGTDGTGDPAVLMPVLDVYPDALSAPMPDAMVAVPRIDLPAALAAARLSAPVAPQQAQRQAFQQVPQPGRYGRSAGGNVPRPPPAARPPVVAQPVATQPVAAAPVVARYDQPRPMSARLPSAVELTDWARSGFTGPMPHGAFWDSSGARDLVAAARRSAAGQRRPVAPAPPAPRGPARPTNRRTTRRNKGSSIWAVLIFLVVIAFASGLGQQLLRAISELFNR